MTNDYALATLKIDRAKKHISELCEAIDSFAARKPYRFVEDRESEPGQLLLRVHAAEAIPNEFPLMLGDGIHNLRAALDIMTCVIVPNGRNIKSCQFPFAEDLKGF
jgi:hypothetical protein